MNWVIYRKSLNELNGIRDQEYKRLYEEEKKYGKPKTDSDYDPWRDDIDYLMEIEEEIRSLKTRRILNDLRVPY